MSSMMSGFDLIFETPRQGFDIRLILDAILELWPDGAFQDAEEESVCPLTAVLADQTVSASSEFFVYKDNASAESWEREGWTAENGDDMAHFLIATDAGAGEVLQLTLVVGSFTGETVGLIDAVSNALVRMSAGEQDFRKRTRRVDWETELRLVGYTLGRERFYDKCR